MVKCICGKAIEKMPTWLESVQVDFICTNCPKRQVKTIAQLNAEAAMNATTTQDTKLAMDVLEDEDADEEETI